LIVGQKLFGVTFGIGIRNRPPKKGETPVTMHHGDIVNLVDVRNNNDAPMDRYGEFVSSQGVDFIFESSSRSLKIRVRYKRFLAQNECVVMALNLGVAQLPVQAELRDATALVAVGTMFLREDSIVEVINVNGNSVLIQDSDSALQYMIGLDEAAEFISNCLG
jgi:cephalosporin hydroxylase